MKIITNSINITALYKSINIQNINTESIKNKIIDTLGIDTQVALSQFPDLLTLIIPTAQMSLIAVGRRFQVIDSSTVPYEDRDKEKFIKLVLATNQIIASQGSELEAYGFNHVITIDFEATTSKTTDYLFEKYIGKKTKIKKAFSKSATTTSLGFRYEKEGLIYNIKFEPLMVDVEHFTNKMQTFINIHKKTNSFPSYSELKGTFEAKYQEITDSITNFFAE